MEILDEIRKYFASNSKVWEQDLQDCRTYSEVASIIRELKASDAKELLGVAISYVSAATSKITIYQEALVKLRQSDEDEVDRWLENLGFGVQHNKLGKRLVYTISQIFQNVMQVISNFIQGIIGVLNMKLAEVQFQFSASPAVSLTFK